MRITPVNNYSQEYNNYLNNKNVKEIKIENSNKNLLPVNYCSKPVFKCKATLENVLNDYKWFIRKNNVPPIESFLKIDVAKELKEDLFKTILNSNDLSYNFIDSIVTQPRLMKHYAKKLSEALPKDGNVLNLEPQNNPYKLAYKRYIEARYNNTRSISELLKIRPDWSEEALLKKHRELYHNDDFVIGRIPESIGDYHFSSIIAHLKDYLEFGYKTPKKIKDLNINGQTFKFIAHIDGRSDKNVFQIITPSEKSYIIKMSSEFYKGLNKTPTIGTCSMIDSYLTQNNCRNSAPFRYYDHNNNLAIYDYIEHEKAHHIHSIQKLKENMPDFVDLGLMQNDTVGSNNYFLLDKNQNAMKSTYDYKYGVDHNELVSVDNDHVTYNQSLAPMIPKYHTYLPNGMQMFF